MALKYMGEIFFLHLHPYATIGHLGNMMMNELSQFAQIVELRK